MKNINKWFACLLTASVVLTSVTINAVEPNLSNPSSVIIANTSTELEIEESSSKAGDKDTTTIPEDNEIFDNVEDNKITTDVNETETSEEITSEEINSLVTTLSETEDTGSEEVYNWEIGVVFYDSTIDNGHTPLTEINWDAVDKDDERVITVQINYRNTNVTRTYQPNELNFTIPSLTYDIQGERSLRPWGDSFDAPTISAGTIEQGYDWNYETKDGTIIFTNNNTIEQSSNFEGSIQIAYTLLCGKIINNTSKTMNAVLSNNSAEILTSNDIIFNFTSSRSSYNLIKNPSALKGADALPNADNYIWVQWSILSEPKWDGVRIVDPNSVVFEEIVPEGALVYDKKMNLLEAVDGKIRFNRDSYFNEESEAKVYIAYPKDRYEGQKITNTINSYGVYWDETELSFLATYSKEIDLKNYSFSYTGNLYGIYKSFSSDISSNWSRKDHEDAYCLIQPLAVYTGGKMDVVIGDDFLFAPNQEGIYERLTDDEYYFTKLVYDGPCMININGASIKDYDMDLYVRYKNTQEYVKYGDTLKANKRYHPIYFIEGVVGWKLVIHDMEESLAPRIQSSIINPSFSICKKDIADTGYLYNFAYIQVYKDGVLQNEPTLDSYDTNSTKLDIATLDQETYGTYMQRYCAKADIISNSLDFYVYKNGTPFVNYPLEEKFKNSWRITSGIELDYGTTDNFQGMCFYDLLPKGMELESTEEEIISNLTLRYYNSQKNVEKKSGIKFTNETDFLNYWKDRCVVTIKQNWKNTGRTWLKVEFGFSDDPLSFTKLSKDDTDVEFVDINISTSVSYDAYLEYGSTYKNHIYLYVEETDDYDVIHKNNTNYNDCMQDKGILDPDAVDINENETTDDYLFRHDDTQSISTVIATHQDVQKQVQTDKNNFTTETATSSYDSEYTYKLRVRTGQNDVTNLVIYDSIEKYIKDKSGNIVEAYGKKDHWNGQFLDVDTSYAESKGYVVKTWCSEKENAGNLYNEDGSLNTNYKEYTTGLKPDYSKSVTIVSPNWPNNYPSDMKEDNVYWEETFSGASQIQIVFDDTSKTEKNYDYINIYDKDGVNKYGKLSDADFAGKTYIIDGDYVKLTMTSDSSIQYKGFSATITPLYKETSIDKSKVKSLAFEYLDGEGNKAILPANSLTYVLVKMKSPADETTQTFAYNGCYTEWNAVDEFGNPVDFITGINSNVVKVGLLNSVDDVLPVININFTKDIVGEDKAFNYIKLDKNALYSFAITMKEKETGNVYNGVVNNKNVLTFTEVPYGTYEIEESNNHYFDFVDMIDNNGEVVLPEGISLSKDNGKYVLTISDTIKEDLSYNIKVTNEIKKERLYEEKNEIFNVFAAVKKSST